MLKSWIKFVAMQHNDAILIYELYTMKDTAESYIKKNCTAIQNSTVQSLCSCTYVVHKSKKLVWATLNQAKSRLFS